MRRPWTLLTALASTLLASSAFALTISAVGDVMMGSNYNQNGLPANDGRDLFTAAAPYLQTTDLRFANFEGTLFDGAPPRDAKAGGANRYIFRTPTRMGARLSEAGFNVVSLANNHAMDFGRAGVNSTKKTLQALGIQYSSKDGEVAEFNVNGVRVAVLATDFYPGRRSITAPAATLAEITALKADHEIVIVSCHAGGEGAGAERTRNANEIFLGENRGNSVDFARRAVMAGADLILMHGPHVPRGMEVYRDRLIVYSLGNFLTEKGISVAGRAGLAPLVRIDLEDDGRFKQGHLASFKQSRDKGLTLDEMQSAMIFIAQVSQVDFPKSHPEFNSKGYFRANRAAVPAPLPAVRP